MARRCRVNRINDGGGGGVSDFGRTPNHVCRSSVSAKLEAKSKGLDIEKWLISPAISYLNKVMLLMNLGIRMCTEFFQSKAVTTTAHGIGLWPADRLCHQFIHLSNSY